MYYINQSAFEDDYNSDEKRYLTLTVLIGSAASTYKECLYD